jgi:hypothetical protein
LFAAILAATGLHGIAGSQAATSTVTLEAETMTLPSRANVVSDANASGGKAVELYINGTANGSVSLPSPTTGLSVTARADQCNGAAQMAVKVDAVQVGTTTGVAATTWTAYSFPKSLSAGSHAVSISFTNDYATTTCDRNLLVDKLTFTGDAVTSSNLALNKPATASSVERTGLEARNAVDGGATTRWGSAFSDPQWISVDLGSIQAIGRVKLTWEVAYAKGYQIQTSADAVNWTTIYSTTTGDGGTDDLSLSGSGRYVRMYGTVRGTQWGYSLWEFEVYGSSSGPPSGQAMPVGDVTSGGHTWKQIATEDFTKDAALGSWNDTGTLTSCPPNRAAVYYTGATGTPWTAYPKCYKDTYQSRAYRSDQVLSVHNGVLDFWLHTVDGHPAGANPSPYLPNGSQYQTYGRYEVRLRQTTQSVSEFYQAWLLWPQTGAGECAESDFPEAPMDVSSVSAYAHYGCGAAQDSFSKALDRTQWHTYTQEWQPGKRSYYVDGVLIGSSTNQVWSNPERWQLQTETKTTCDTTTPNTCTENGHLLVDWAVVYAY